MLTPQPYVTYKLHEDELSMCFCLLALQVAIDSSYSLS